MKKMLLAAILVFLASCGPQNTTDNYRETLKQFILADSTNITIQKMQMKMFVTNSIAQSPNEISTEEAQKMEKGLDKYIATQYIDDMIDIMLPCYRENVSEQQMQQIADLMSRPDIKQAYTHIMSLSSGVLNNIGPTLTKGVTAIMYGQKPTKPFEADCTENYRHKFETYWKSNGIERIMSSTVDKALGNDVNNIDADKVKSIVELVVDMTKALMLNTLVYNITEAELDSMIELTTSDGYHAQLNAMECLIQDPTKMLKDIEEAFVHWYIANSESMK